MSFFLEVLYIHLYSNFNTLLPNTYSIHGGACKTSIKKNQLRNLPMYNGNNTSLPLSTTTARTYTEMHSVRLHLKLSIALCQML